jgi:hypothetical protein
VNGEEEDHLRYWIETFRRANGYASDYHRRDSRDKAIIELTNANEWSRSMLAEFGIDLGEAHNNPNDPPDAFFVWAGRGIGVELVELVEKSHKERAISGQSPYRGRLFLDSQWNAERFRVEVQRRIDAKGERCARKGIIADALVIHTAEPWLISEDAREWVNRAPFASHPNVSNAFLIFRYEGSGHDHRPLLRLYGDMGA